MRQLIIIVILVAAFAPGRAFCQGQQDPNDIQNPKEYTDEDANPLKMIATILNPVGYFLEWTVARPLHYLATDSPLAPVFGGNDEEDTYLYGKTTIPPSLAEMPPSDMAPTGSADSDSMTSRSGTSGSSPPAHVWQPSTAPPSSSSAPLSSQQPVMH
ncbi:MAG TPA: hypothetical protein VMB26_08505 [Candidatus Binataceae bacterium]|nr:hypothetical protein [Candidatus Binataceae bacterium]